jgi:type IV secretory pathway VirB10-like protein
MTDHEHLISKLPKPKGMPSKYGLKVASAVLLLLVLGVLIFSYDEEPVKTGDDLARAAASTLNTVELTHVDQNHQIIEDAFKASGLPADLSGLQIPSESVPTRASGLQFSMSSPQGSQDQGVMRSAAARANPLPQGALPQASFKGNYALPPSSPVPLQTPSQTPFQLPLQAFSDGAPNSVTLAQEAEVMNSKIVIVDFDDPRRPKESLNGGEKDRTSVSSLPASSALGNASLKEQRLKSLSASLEELQQGAGSRPKSSLEARNSLAPSSSDSPAVWEALAQVLGSERGVDKGSDNAKYNAKDNARDQAGSISSRSQDGEFLREIKNNPLFKPGLRPNRLESERSILEGTIIPAVLTRDINSDLPGTLTAQVTQTVYDSVSLKTPLICKGAKLIGRYNNDIRTGQSRLLFAFTRLILLNGQSFNLTGFDGADALGQAGVGGEVNNHFLRIYGSSLAIGALSDQITRQQAVPQGAFASPSATGQIMVQTTREILQKGRDIAPTITVAKGSLINVEVRQDLVFTGGDRVSCS